LQRRKNRPVEPGGGLSVERVPDRLTPKTIVVKSRPNRLALSGQECISSRNITGDTTMTDDRLKNFIGAALDLEDRARDYIDSREPAHAALVIALKNFSVAHQSLRDAASEALTESERPGR
jgi:hypothetical protein